MSTLTCKVTQNPSESVSVCIPTSLIKACLEPQNRPTVAKVLVCNKRFFGRMSEWRGGECRTRSTWARMEWAAMDRYPPHITSC